MNVNQQIELLVDSILPPPVVASTKRAVKLQQIEDIRVEVLFVLGTDSSVEVRSMEGGAPLTIEEGIAVVLWHYLMQRTRGGLQ